MESHTFVGGFFIKLIAYTMKKELKGNSYKQRVIEVNEIFDVHAREHLTNREIWRRYLYPVYGFSERTMYNLLKARAFISFEEEIKP